MKFPFFKSLILAGALVVAWNCSDSGVVNSIDGQAFEQVKTLNIGGQSVYINDNNEVKDANGNIIGTYDPQTLTIIGTQGETILENVEKDELQTTQIGTDTQAGGQGSGSGDSFQGGTGSQESTYGGQGGIYGGQQTGGQGTQQTGGQSDQQTGGQGGQQTGGQGGQQTGGQGGQQTGGQGGQQTGGQGGQQTGGNTDNPPASGDGKCYDKLHNQYVEPYVQGLRGPNDENYSFDDNCSMVCWWSQDKNQCSEVKKALAGGGGQQTGGQSSSSKYVASSSSIVSGGGQQQGSTPNFKIKQNGRSGNGWGSRYWDCCMPHCAWSGNTKNPTKTCNSQMQEIGESGGSACNSGSGGVCDFQAPWAASENLAYAFAAVPAGLGGECGKCFLLTFDGGSHGNSARTGALKGKQMVIMVSNIGGDVGSNQFDIMIPGGGVGQFNGCGVQLGIGSTGAQYGGFISDCSSNNDPVSCVKNKCSIFSKYPKLQAGCEFSATWYNAADNPTFRFEELESCPNDISSKW